MDGSHEREDRERRALAALMDPAVLERRLGEARIRREAALSARRQAVPATPAPAPPPGRLLAAAPPDGPGPLVAPARAPSSAPPPKRSGRRAPLAAIFIAGSLAGALAAGIGPHALDLLADPPRPPPGIAANPPPPPEPSAAARRVPVAVDAGPAVPARAITPAALPDRPFALSLEGARIVLSAPSGADAAAIASAMRALEEANPGGLTRADARVTIRTANVRYFHAADRSAAAEIATLLGAALGSEPEIRDFTDFTPPPSKGAIEVWLPGDAPASTAGRVARPQSGPAAAVMDSVRRARGALERALDSLPVITLR